MTVGREMASGLPSAPGPLDQGFGVRPREVDVVVLGGGPAGIATALALTRLGRSVAVLERSAYHTTRVGETLPPEVRLPLLALGVWERFLASGPVASPGTVSFWGGPEPAEEDFLFNPYGNGWHVDRVAFDVMLARALMDSGGSVLDSARLASCIRAAPSSWELVADVRGGSARFRARLLVDATGRAATLARRLGSRRVVHDCLVGLVSYQPPRVGGDDADRRALVEAVEDGWWYTAPLQGGRRVAAFMTDSDLLPRGRGLLSAFWRDRLAAAPATASRLAARHSVPPRARRADSSRLDVAAGGDWLAVGDAAAAVDPLSSQGVYRALVSGIEAARAAAGRLDGDRAALGEYASGLELNYRDYLARRRVHYGRERRWPESPFWRRRTLSQLPAGPV
jgi:flavin-dependent dehydrogenase